MNVAALETKLTVPKTPAKQRIVHGARNFASFTRLIQTELRELPI